MAEIYTPAADSVRRMACPKGWATKLVETNINHASAYIQMGDIENPAVYSKACMNLGSTIDSAIAMDEVPSSSHLFRLALIVKEVYRRKTEMLQPSLMLLMLPIKAACRIGWFPDKDKDDLLMMAKEVSYGFSDTNKMGIEPSYAHSYVSNIISRFYPRMKVENILTSFDVKAGYGTFVADFHISRGTLPRHYRNLMLLVARMDNMDTAACIASPLNVEFLVNGSGVPRRTKSNMGKGPQLPSNVFKMIKYGVNLLQVLGDFDGQYIIAVAFMNLISSPDPPQLQDYVYPMSDGIDSDCNVIEMSSRISLDCPISRLRIRTPVKGHLCKHPQCFDYKYFMEINSRWPTWKCPLCNKPVCNLDIRIDQKFVKILNEVAEDVSDVIISADGSWTASMTKKSQTTETNRNTLKQNNHVPDTTGNVISVEANDTLPNSSSVLHISGGSAIGVNAERPSTLWQSTVTMDAVSPAQVQQQSQGACGMVRTPLQQTRHHLNPVNLTMTRPSYSSTNPNHPSITSAQSQPQQVQAFGATQADIGTTKKAQSTTLFSPVQLTPSATSSPHSVPLAFEQLRRGGKQGHYTAPGQSQLAPNLRPVSPTLLPEPSGDAMPSGRMRGSLRGDELAAARLQFLAPPRQPTRANEPWSRPTPTLPTALLMQEPPTNSERTQNVPISGNMPQGASSSFIGYK